MILVMRYTTTVKGNYQSELEENLAKKLQELQSAGNEIVNVSVGGRADDSSHMWLAIVLYEKK